MVRAAKLAMLCSIAWNVVGRPGLRSEFRFCS
jgi:hypothetical protein